MLPNKILRLYNFRTIIISTRSFSLAQLKCLRITHSMKTTQRSDGSGSEENFEVCTISDCMVDPCKPEPSVVIVGAGVAGLSAAHRLQQCGISNFTILEATDRPGGRIHSCWLGDVIAEMGAQYIEGGCMANPIYNLAAQEGLLQPPLERPDPLKGFFCTSDGRAVDVQTTKSAYHVFRKIENEAAALFSTAGVGKNHGSLMNFMTLRIQQELLRFPEEERYDVSRVMFGLLTNIRSRVGENLCQVSADNYGSYVGIPGGKLRVPLGFVGVLSPLLRDLPECAIKYNKPVGSIRWGTISNKAGGPRAVVMCCDGDQYHADYVIITVSLGVLKHHADKLFCPPLSSEKMEAIHNLGFGHVDKIFLDYCRPFWVWNEGGVKFAWSPDEQQSRQDWTKGLSSVEEVENSKHVLCAYVSGPEALEMERASDEEVAEGVTRVLRQFTGDASLPFPSTILRSKWSCDPYFCGAVSYMSLTSCVGHQCDLSTPLPGPCEPVAPILLFAGEATCTGHFSTVHGARLSGIREAERILKLTREYGGPPKC